MNIYFGRVPQDILNDTDPSDWIKCPMNDELYEFVLEVDQDDVHITDSVGRSVPVNVDHLEDLYNALIIAHSSLKNFRTADIAREKALIALNDKDYTID